ncbi:MULTISPECIES: ribulose-phosphate 3-epimerase [Peptoniphilus]|uniref:ribulose-phosphate 3-epimerase n=1 Tax=Peptoniphilus TaxID=162289 RepID=UPI0008DACBCC|nr:MULTISPECIES: ribulose-phosphate 3-epimerase [Peptoniphilus]MBS6610210.1 ribulose-phosphate 3-epimerase [Peptoniphilus harei]MDU1043298.1 ribulose-phosphate 3-epimerase [Peptoniphilus rhinitidis]MDU1954015.1 ribulose-phosphate 3-epimerase [Peptoniphilus lacydonensis]MDU2109672.1 ribulose-phosphate 3-epimerase [Peptoniphilus lacydonensis]MDU2115253.1 ribulose-phosphate 3-epimerase [Peptoniphilus lacydonensis]
MISPSLLSADFTNLEKEFKILNEEKVDFIHLDIMDGNYVPNISYGPGIVKSLRPLTEIPFDTHLMIEKPENYIEEFVKSGSDIITIHPSTTKHLDRTLSIIRSFGKKTGLALNPGDSLGVLDYNLEKLDLVLVMSVNPGFGGQKFIPSSLRKIKEIKKIIEKRNLETLIEVDGGVKLDNAKEILDAGADILVAGSAIFEKDKTRGNIKSFKEIL